MATPDAERSMAETIPAYAKTVFLKWWWLICLLGAIATEIAFVVLGFQLPPVAWVVLFVVAFVVANVQVFHLIRPPTDRESLGLPYWASMATNANADGTWLVVIEYGFEPEKPAGTEGFPSVLNRIANYFGYERQSLNVESYGSGMQIKFPIGFSTPWFMVQFGGELVPFGSKQSRAFEVSHRIAVTDQVHIGWVLARLDEALKFLLSDISHKVVNPKRLRRVFLTLNEWPEKGIAVEGLLTAVHSTPGHWRGNKASGTFTISKNMDTWALTKQFGAVVLGKAGYMGFEPELRALSREAVAPYRLSDGNGKLVAGAAKQQGKAD